MSKVDYYVCEQDDIDHDFKTVRLKVNRTLYPQAQVCKRCGSIFDLGNLGADIKKVVAQLSGMDLTQFKLKEATKTNQAVLLARKMERISRPTVKGKAFHERLIKTLLTKEEERKHQPSASPWRMNG